MAVRAAASSATANRSRGEVMPDDDRSAVTRDFVIAALAAQSVTTPEARLDGIGKLVLASVLVPLVPRPHGVQVLLTQRADHLRGHPSQISFPGGQADAADADAVATALRETEEEVGIG